jgi:Holliday junction resolvasome RuvABC endonuclease subunit
MYLGIDPGSVNHGWALVDQDKKWAIASHGHNDLDYIRETIEDWGPIDEIIIEGMLIYKLSNPNDLIPTIINIGRIIEIAHVANIPVTMIPRPEIIKILTGKRPCKGHKVTKASMQKTVQKILKLKSVVKPQHANDSIAAILAAKYPRTLINVKPKPKARAKKSISR